MSPVELDSFYQQTYGISRTEMNADFIGFLDRSVRILEVGANVGDQLSCLRAMDFQNLHGIELQSYAVEVSKRRTKGINIIQGSAFDLPYRDGYFDLVFTSCVLIHIAPTDLLNVLREILRVSNHYIWGFEYYSDEPTEIVYRGNQNLLWKRNFAKLYCDHDRELKLVKEKKYKYLANNDYDQMYLLAKGR
jgi:pseudaminic acid biosynthesis-associated methylase